ncbi:high copy suppressor of abf2 [Pestalotiopsis sp. IQ-011]
MSQALDKAMADVMGSGKSASNVYTFDKYVDALIPLMRKLTTQRPFMARLAAFFSDEVRQVDRQLKQMTALFTPTLEQCANDIEQGLEHSSVNNEWFEDLVRLAPPEKRRDYQFLTNIFMGFAFTFIFSPVPVTTQIIYEVAFRPDYAELVLQEAREVLGERQDDRAFSREDIRRLSLLDSFCKETHKHHPTAASNMKKITIKPQALANGIVLPAGTVFEVVEIAAHLANPAFENPAEWDGHRYFDLRQKASSAGASTSKYDWGAATRDDLNFGYATHMCPGRSAGCSIVKMFIVKLLSRYEICLDDGETERYEDVHFGQFSATD